MPYTPQTWADNNGTYPLSAARMTVMENGIQAATATAELAVNLTLNQQTVTSYTLLLSDRNKMVEMNNASANTVTVPLNSAQAFPIGAQVTILQSSTGQTTIASTAGVTVNGTPGLKLRTQWSSATLVKRGTDIWVAIGDLVA